MKLYSLFMCLVKTLISRTPSHTLVVWSITMVGQVKKCYGGLAWPCPAWPVVLWTHSARVSSIIGTCADGQRFESSNLCLLYNCETWTLNTDLKKQIDVFGNKCLHSIMGYHWNDFVSNQRLLRKTESRHITNIVQHQLRVHGHVARYLQGDPACRVISKKDNSGWRRLRGAHKVHGWD